jgi:hypothetical protein
MKQVDLNELIKKIEIRYITKAIKETNGNVTEASKLIGVNRTTLIMMMQRLNINIDRQEKKVKTGINVETVKKVNVEKLDDKMLKAYKVFSNMTKEQKVDIVMPLNDLPIHEISMNKLEKRFELLIHGEYKETLIKKLRV